MKTSCRNAWCSARLETLWHACAPCSRHWVCLDSLLNPMWEEASPRNASRVPWTSSPTRLRPNSERRSDGAVAHGQAEATWGEADPHIASDLPRHHLTVFFLPPLGPPLVLDRCLRMLAGKG